MYKITVADGNGMTRVSWKLGTYMTFKSSLDEPINLNGRWSLCFFVPRGTKVIGLFGGGGGAIVDPEGKTVFDLNEHKPGYYRVPVPPDQEGKLWQIRQASGAVRLLTVPPYLARQGAELLLPREVVVER